MKWACLLLLVTAVGCGKRVQYEHRLGCMNNLRQLGGLLKLREVQGKLKPVPGAGFLLQLWDDIPPEDREVYVCPSDPRAAAHRATRYGSYLGPDEATLDRMSAEPRNGKLVIAACPHHEDGVVVLYSSSKVEFLKDATVPSHLVR